MHRTYSVIGSAISVGPKGIIEFGNDFLATANTKLISFNNIVFGKYCRVAWEVIVMDTDLHQTINKETGKKNTYKKIGAFERALKKNGIDKELLLDNMQKIILELISSLHKEDLTKEDIDFFAIKKALFKPNQEILITQSKVRALILKSTETTNYFEMLYFVTRKNRRVLTARIEIGCTEIFKMMKREDLSMEKAISVLQSLLEEKYNKMLEQRRCD